MAKHGIAFYFLKPFDPAVLAARAASALERVAPPCAASDDECTVCLLYTSIAAEHGHGALVVIGGDPHDVKGVGFVVHRRLKGFADGVRSLPEELFSKLVGHHAEMCIRDRSFTVA